MPTKTICDAHVHLMDQVEGMEYAKDDLVADLGGPSSANHAVFVECGSHYLDHGPEHLRPVGETRWVASTTGVEISAIVGYADLRLGDGVAEVVEAHLEVAGDRFRGIRQVAAWDADPRIRPMVPDPGPSLLLDDRFRRGFRELERRELSFDAYLYFPQLPELVDLARAFPDTTIVLDHLGGPISIASYADRDVSLEVWRSHMESVAECENIFLKVGGMGMAVFGLGWHRRPTRPGPGDLLQAWREPVEWCLDRFGAERCMFESNFPVDRGAFDYADLWTAYEALAGPGSHDHRRLFHDTAASAYRLDPLPSE